MGVKTFEMAFLEKYPHQEYVLKRMDEYDNHPSWGKFTRPYLAGLARYFRENMSDSSARVALSYIKAVLNEYKEEIVLPTENFKDVLTVRNVKSMNTWLNEEELESLDYETDAERKILFDFLLGSYTGARHSDFSKFSSTNIVNGVIMYTSEKTGILATVPIKPVVRKMLSYPRSSVTHQQFNKVIKLICKRSGITNEIKLFNAGKEITGAKWKFISSHTARRSFATNLYLRGVDIFSISKMMGHSSVEMTKGYIVCGLRELPDEAMAYFK